LICTGTYLGEVDLDPDGRGRASISPTVGATADSAQPSCPLETAPGKANFRNDVSLILEPLRLARRGLTRKRRGSKLVVLPEGVLSPPIWVGMRGIS
jgi:hypothetical protein